MKKMKKVRAIVVLGLTLISFQSMSQTTIDLGGGLMKSTEENAEALLGGELAVKYDISEKIRMGVNVGFYQKSQEIFGTKFISSLVPVSISGEYKFLEDKLHPYVGVHVGILRAGVDAGSTSSSDIYFSLAPVAGVDYRITDKIGVNANFKYGFTFYKNDFTDELENYSTLSPNVGLYYAF